MTVFNMTRDINGYNGFGRIPSTDLYSTTLAENTAQTFTAPTGYAKYLAIFSFDPGLRVFTAYNALGGSVTAQVPGDTVASTNSELNPMAWEVLGGSTISVITPDTAAYAGVVFYALL